MKLTSHKTLPALGTARVRARGRAFLFALAVLLFGAAHAEAQDITGVPLLGKIEYIFLDDPADPWSSGTIIIEGTPVIVPRNLLIDLPANRLTLQQLFTDAPPACLANGETGLAMTDLCLEGQDGAYGQILANRMPSGHFIAGDIFIAKGSTGEAAGALIPTTFGGFVSYIDHTDGYIVVNGTMGALPREAGGPATNEGYIVRINDPEGVHTIQQGLGCDGGPNCSPDARFTNDPENYTVTGSKGFPLCIPSTVTGIGSRTVGSDANGVGDPFCPDTNRNLGGVTGRVVPDSRRFVPIQLGDDVGGEGNWEIVNGVRFFSCHTFSTAYGFDTRRTPDQPDYLTMAEVEWDAPGFSNQRNKSLFIGFSTLQDSPVDIFALHVDPQTGENNEYILGSTIGNLDTTFQGVAPNAGGIFKIGYDIDFIKGAPVSPDVSPCQKLLNAGFPVCPLGGTMDEEFSIMSPVSREVIARSRHRAELLPGNEPLNILGEPAAYGQYLTPIGVGHPEFVEIDLDKNATSFIFSGEPWNLDRRLGPGGCDDDDTNGVCDSTLPLGEHGLDPFPISGMEPRTQADLPGFSQDRVFAHHPFGTTDFAPYPPVHQPDPVFLSFAFAAPPGNRCGVPNEVPVAQADAAGLVTDEDTPLLILESTLLANDGDADGDAIFIYQIDAESRFGGSVSLSGTGEVLYVPAADFNGSDTFAYFISDRHGGTAQALVTVTVLAINDAPIALNDDVAAPISPFPITITKAFLLSNDSDPDGDLIEFDFIDVFGSLGGILTETATTLTYTLPAGVTSGVDVFLYDIIDEDFEFATAELRFHIGNDHPFAEDDFVITDEDQPIVIDVVANDFDFEGDPMTVINFTQPFDGTVEQVGPTTLLYTPNLEFSGFDFFDYEISDGRGGTSFAFVDIEVLEVNDPPVAVPDFAVTLEDTEIFIDVLANDFDPEGGPLGLILDPTQNLAGFEAALVEVVGNQIRYVPLPDVANGLPDSIIYTVTDGVTTSTGVLAVSVTPVNDAPIAIPDLAVTLEDFPVTINPLLNDFDIENDSLRVLDIDVPAGFPAQVSFTQDSITFVPDPDFNDEVGQTIFYTVGDGRDTTLSSVTLIVVAENDAPIANDDLGNVTPEDTPINIPVLANDVDVDGNPLTVFAISTPLLGTATQTATGILYTPAPDANGVDSFEYSLTDNFGGVSTATVAVTITPANDAPDAGDDGPVPLAEDTVRLLSTTLLFSNDVDVDGDPLELIAISAASNGTLELVRDPADIVVAVRYTPNANYSGPDSFEYTIVDPSGESSTGTVTLSVLPVNDPPVASNDIFVIDQDTSGTLSVLPNDNDADGDLLTVSAILSAPTNGTATINPNNTIAYTPNPGFFGVDTLVYQASDGNGGLASATASIAVQEVITLSASFVRGDTNHDGQLNVSDPIGTLVVLFQGAPAVCLASHDTNDDESVNVGDIIFSLNYIFSTGQQPSAPFIFCGEDPTGGLLTCEATGTCN